ncbi:MAG: TIGR00266 family protein [Deltaproteobacteria bacterium]|nr:TIGR00266 family protein [Deltaproteobacteria bacterium]
MQHQILYKPSYAMAIVTLQPGESIDVEAGSMVAMTHGMKIKTMFNGNSSGFFGKMWNFFVAIFRKLLGGETMMINRYSPPTGQTGQIYVAPAMTGDIIQHKVVPGQDIIIQGTSFLASTGNVKVKLKWGGLRSLFGGEGLFLLRATGDGELWVNSYGAIYEIDVNGSYIVDTGHIVAFQNNLQFKIKRVGGWKSTLFSGEGLVCEFHGQGKLWIQTRNLGQLVHWLTPILPA